MKPLLLVIPLAALGGLAAVIRLSLTPAGPANATSVMAASPSPSPAAQASAAQIAGRTSDYAADIAVQPDGRVVVAGQATIGYPSDPHGDMALARYTAAGEPDPTFGDAGRVTTDLAGRQDSAAALALQADGKLVVAGMTCLISSGSGSASPTAFDCDLVLARYQSGGELDATFGGDGVVQMDFVPGHEDGASALAIQSDGKIVAAGSTRAPGAAADFALARFNPDGSLDAAFGGAGVVVSDLGGDETLTDMALLSDGRIVVAGASCCITVGSRFALARYNPDGSLDAAFDGDGYVVRDLPVPVGRFNLLPEGGAVGVGCSGNSAKTRIHVVRFNSAGALDAGFGEGGLVTTDAGGTYQCAADAAFQKDGKIVTAGHSMGIHGGCMCYFLLTRYNGDGSLDTAFGAEGSQWVDFSERGLEGASAVAIAPGGGLVVAGSEAPYDGEPDLAVARLLNDGALDTAFGADGQVTTDFGGLISATQQPVFRVLLPLVTR